MAHCDYLLFMHLGSLFAYLIMVLILV